MGRSGPGALPSGVRRRGPIRFAAPLVMVTACGQAPAPALPVAPPPAIASAWAPSLIDAGPPPPPIDAATPDAAVAIVTPTGPRPGHVLVRLPERMAVPAGYVSCHDFGPTSRGCNPPRPESVPAAVRELPIQDVRRSPGGTLVTIALGFDDGVGKNAPIAVRWPRPRDPTPAARLVSLSSRTMVVEVALGRDDLARGLELEVDAPDPMPWQPLPPIEARIVTIEPGGDRRIIELDVGRADGVLKGTTGVVVDRAGRPLPDGTFVVMIVDTGRAFATVDLGRAALKRAGRVHLDRR